MQGKLLPLKSRSIIVLQGNENYVNLLTTISFHLLICDSQLVRN